MEIARSLLVTLGLIAVAQAQQVPQLSHNLHEIANLKSFRASVTLSKADLAMLRKNWFFVAPSESFDVWDVYGQNDYDYIPSFVTADNAIQLMHVCFDSTLENIERTKLSSGIRKMSAAMLATAIKDWKVASHTAMAEASAKNVAYFGVADRLGGGKEPIPAPILPMVDKTVAMIQAHEGFQIGPIFPYRMDFSQFVPRGHYARNPLLSRYFRTMMWYGLTPFANPKIPGGSLVPIEQGLLMSTELAHSAQLARWQRVYDVSAMLMGPSNHHTPLEAEVCAKRIFGPKPTFGQMADKGKVEAFIAELEKSRKPAFTEEDDSADGPGKIQIRFMGQRAVPDSEIMQSLIGLERRRPSPLDVMAVLGSRRAKSILDASPKIYNPDNWTQYVPIRNRLTAEFGAKPAGTWTSDIYWEWMDCLRAFLNPQETAGQPALATSAWADKSLQTALASWTEMKHDTILYGQQPSNAEQGEDGERAPNLAKGFVEPNLALYTRMDSLLSNMERELVKRSYLSQDTRVVFERLIGIVRFFEQVSKKEIAHKKLTPDEYERIRSIEGELGDTNITLLQSGMGYEVLTPDDENPALVADYATDNATALEAGVGRCDHLYALIRIEGKLYLMRGASLSYFEFERPSSDRMTDEAWKKQLDDGKLPARPNWIRSFFINKSVDEHIGMG